MPKSTADFLVLKADILLLAVFGDFCLFTLLLAANLFHCHPCFVFLPPVYHWWASIDCGKKKIVKLFSFLSAGYRTLWNMDFSHYLSEGKYPGTCEYVSASAKFTFLKTNLINSPLSGFSELPGWICIYSFQDHNLRGIHQGHFCFKLVFWRENEWGGTEWL